MPDQKVVALRGGALPGAPQPELVALLERLLAHARDGDLQWLAYAGVCADDSTEATWAGDCRASIAAGCVGWLHHKFFDGYGRLP